MATQMGPLRRAIDFGRWDSLGDTPNIFKNVSQVLKPGMRSPRGVREGTHQRGSDE
jgi:hypothetical protein